MISTDLFTLYWTLIVMPVYKVEKWSQKCGKYDNRRGDQKFLKLQKIV